ncbi:MAG: hypothetical protein C4543_00525 [Ignavibacteriales bacterium]|nr:MAG: hypothetical protein C4543_00525 [Ignavibacteriales bacterium]
MFNTIHKFHIPVMGLGFSIDTPIKVAHYGIDSVISIMDDDLIEKIREYHSAKAGITYEEIKTSEYDFRAKRITAYLNLVNEIVNNNFEALKNSFGKRDGEFKKYIELLPNDSDLKIIYNAAETTNQLDSIKDWALDQLHLGSIDINIMTKVDGAVYKGNEKLPIIHNYAHAALRGYANSDLNSSIVLSAGMNPRLYSYFEEFKDFYPTENGELRKKIILKVSDYRSALIQGKFLAKKGLWISEYRIESGLNCGGHAFASDGFLMGPILEEFKKNRNSLLEINHQIYTEALRQKNIEFNKNPHQQKFTAQGGVGTYEEQQFLIDNYKVDSVGWGSPFLLVPEVTNVDPKTLRLLSDAKEDDLYLSRISPLGVPFNSIKGNTKDLEKLANALNGKPGSPCPKKYLQSNTEFGEQPICTASIKYQSEKIKELKSQDLNKKEFDTNYKKIIDKACLCVGLATSAVQNYNVSTKIDGEGTLICPGPNMAYFSSIVSLKEMVDHIYGRANLITRTNRPNMFIKELKLYLDYLMDEINEINEAPSTNQLKYFETFRDNLANGIEYYRNLFSMKQNSFNKNILLELKELENVFALIKEQMILHDLLSEDCKEIQLSVAGTN